MTAKDGVFISVFVIHLISFFLFYCMDLIEGIQKQCKFESQLQNEPVQYPRSLVDFLYVPVRGFEMMILLPTIRLLFYID